MSSTLEHAIWVIPPSYAFQRGRETWFLCKGIYVNCMEVVTTIWNTLSLTTLVGIGFCSEIPGVRVCINNTGGLHVELDTRGRENHENIKKASTNRNSYSRIDINAVVQVRCHERDVKVPRCHYCTILRIELIDIILCCSDKDVLYAIIKCINERL